MSEDAVVNHVGHCVADLARSRRFYEELFGFELWYELDIPDAASAKLGRLDPPVGTKLSYLRRGTFVLELISHTDASQQREPARRDFNERGLTHIALSCDIRAVRARVAEYGGEVLTDTDLGVAVFIRDPDGQLLELSPMSYAERVAEV
jgi:catechol 2,3-dioxygenase-like lactoylglutathione lyase family enzyme